MVLKIDNWITTLRYKCRDKFKDDFTIENMKKGYPHDDEDPLRMKCEITIKMATKSSAEILNLVEAKAIKILQDFDESHFFISFCLYTMNRGEPIESIPTLDIFEEFGEAQRVSHETYCKKRRKIQSTY